MILVLSDLWPPFPGGAERLMFNLARELFRAGEDVQVVTGYRDAQAFDGPPVTSRRLGVAQRHAHGWRTIDRAVDQWRPDLIVTHHLYVYEFEAELLRLGIPIVQVVLNTRRVDGVAFAVFISQWVQNRLETLPGDLLITPPALDDVVADTHGDMIGMVKPLEHKGVGLVYLVARAMPDRQFLILRGEWQTLEIIRDDLPNVTYLDPVDDIRDFYRQCRLILMPSRSEDAGTVAQEAAANSLPCISSNVDGLAETNGGVQLDRDDTNGWYRMIKAFDDPEFYREIVGRQHDHLARLGHRGRLDEFVRRCVELRERHSGLV